MVRIVGIDPGVSGAIALFTDEDTNQCVVSDFPTTQLPHQKHRELDYRGIRDIIWAYRPERVFLELVNAHPGKDKETGEDVRFGATSVFRFGGAFYALKAVCACLDLDPVIIASHSWKRHYDLPGGKASKELSRKMAIDLFPALGDDLKLMKHHQRAEAYLIAAYGAYKSGFAGAPRPAPVTPRPKKTKAPATAQGKQTRRPWWETDDDEIPL